MIFYINFQLTAHAGSEWEVGIWEGGSHQVSGVGRDVATFVVTGNGKIDFFFVETRVNST